MKIDFEKEVSNLLLERKNDYPALLYSAMEYAIMGGGKRIRPQLCFLAADFCDVDENKVLPLSLAIECIHSYSLVHDDMPCMDNDFLRRGKPTVHAKFGEAMALLCGDALLNLAYEILFEASNTDPDLLPSCRLIAQCAGASGMVGGQAMEFDGSELTEDVLYVLDGKKTGKLIECAILSSALLSHDPEKISTLSSYAKYAGLAFQLSDDLLDKDKSERSSFVTVSGVEKTKNILLSLTTKTERILKKWNEKGTDLLNFYNLLAFRNQ